MDTKTIKEREMMTEVMLPPVKAMRDLVRSTIREWNKEHSREIRLLEDANTEMRNITVSPEKRYVQRREMHKTISDLFVLENSQIIKIRRSLIDVDNMLEALLSMFASLINDIERLESTEKDVKSLKSHIRRRYEPIMKQIDAAIKKQKQISETEKKIIRRMPRGIYA